MECLLRRSVLGAAAWACFMSTSFAYFADSPRDEPPRYCTVFNHFVKSGGTSVSLQLAQGSRIAQTRHPDLFIGITRTTPAMRLDTLHNASVIVGNGEMVREPLEAVGRDCEYFIMMRHPIERMISMFFYCPTDHDVQNRPSKWCGDSVGHEEPVQDRLIDFIQNKWGNRAFRSMQDSVFCNPDSELCDPEHARRVPLRPKNIDTEEGWLLQDEVKRILSTYTAVGIFEEWELSMRLFDAKVQSPVRLWNEKFKSNSGSRSGARDELLNWAYTSVEVHTMIAADLLLYDYALGIFRQQTKDAQLV
ncbi:unnamed protein product [Laminaria digitata]